MIFYCVNLLRTSLTAHPVFIIMSFHALEAKWADLVNSKNFQVGSSSHFLNGTFREDLDKIGTNIYLDPRMNWSRSRSLSSHLSNACECNILGTLRGNCLKFGTNIHWVLRMNSDDFSYQRSKVTGLNLLNTYGSDTTTLLETSKKSTFSFIVKCSLISWNKKTPYCYTGLLQYLTQIPLQPQFHER